MCNKENQFGHNYIGGTCLDCGRLQETLTYRKYEPVQKKKKELTEEQQLAEEIWLWFGKSPEVKFGFLMGVIKNKGARGVRMCWREVVVDKLRNPVKSFKWKLKEMKMIKEI